VSELAESVQGTMLAPGAASVLLLSLLNPDDDSGNLNRSVLSSKGIMLSQSPGDRVRSSLSICDMRTGWSDDECRCQVPLILYDPGEEVESFTGLVCGQAHRPDMLLIRPCHMPMCSLFTLISSDVIIFYFRKLLISLPHSFCWTEGGCLLAQTRRRVILP
jgi:hypothetical protein